MLTATGTNKIAKGELIFYEEQALNQERDSSFNKVTGTMNETKEQNEGILTRVNKSLYKQRKNRWAAELVF